MSAASSVSPEVSRAIKKRRHSWGQGEVKRHLSFLLMLLPGFMFLVVFNYIPMPGIILAFKDFVMSRPPKGYWLQQPFIYSLFISTNWIGFDNFKFIFSTPDAWIVVRNTVGYSLMFMAVGLVFSIGLALMISELKQRIAAKAYHTVIFLPHFISWIVVSYIVYGLFATNGVFNQTLKALGTDSYVWYNESRIWPFIFLFSNLWKNTGNGSIIYLATINGLDQQLYEAAAIDGAGKWKQITKITLPQLVPTIVLLQILSVGRIFTSDFDMFYSLPNGSGPLRDVALTIDVYVFNAVKSGQKFGIPAAAGLFQSIVGFVLVLTTNLIVRKVQPEMALF